MSEALKVDIWSDVQCPWCYIGKRKFEDGAAQFGGDVEVEEAGGLVVDLDLERPLADAAEDEHHPERGEGEQEDDRRRRRDRRPEARQGDVEERPHG